MRLQNHYYEGIRRPQNRLDSSMITKARDPCSRLIPKQNVVQKTRNMIQNVPQKCKAPFSCPKFVHRHLHSFALEISNTMSNSFSQRESAGMSALISSSSRRQVKGYYTKGSVPEVLSEAFSDLQSFLDILCLTLQGQRIAENF